MDVRQDTNQSKDETLPYGYGLAFPTLFRLRIRKLNLRRWTFWIWLSGVIVAFLYTSLKPLLPPGISSPWFEDFNLGMACFLWGCPGFLFAVRKEAVGRGGGTFRGNDAFFFGIFLMLLWWGAALWILVSRIKIALGI